MKIGVISDTHGSITALHSTLQLLQGVDIILHAGDVLYHPPRLACTDEYDVPGFAEVLNSLDIPVVIAQGNCDAQVYEELLDMPVQSPYAYVSLDGCKIVISHGHTLTREAMIALGKKYQADYFISGHTHVPGLEGVGDLVLMNPGSPAIPKYEIDGRLVPSVGLIDDSGAKILDLETGEVIMSLSK